MSFVELDDLGDDVDELVEDLLPKRCTRNVGLNGAVLMMTKMQKND
jgi:hypothetical protein